MWYYEGFILGPLLVILYVNNLYQVSNILEPIMFADDTNLFFLPRNIKLFKIVNLELYKVLAQFDVNKLSLNKDKTSYTHFHDICKKQNISVKLPLLLISNKRIKQVSLIKFLGILLGKNIMWKDYIRIVENKISKNLGLLYKSKRILNADALKRLYFSFKYSYLHYGNIVWEGSTQTKLKGLPGKQNQAIRIIGS